MKIKILMIENVKVNVENLLDKNRIGHVFTISFDSTDKDNLDFRWYERSDKQYEIGNPANGTPVYNTVNRWADMYALASSYSSVFEELLDEGIGNQTICCRDEPYIQKEANNERTLDFFILIKDNESSWLIKAQQVLKIDSGKLIVNQEFTTTIIENPVLLKPSDNDEDYYEVINF